MKIPKTAHAAIFPQPVVCGTYTLQPPTLLHLAALDRMGCRVSSRVGAHEALRAGFVLSRSYAELCALMAQPDEAVNAACMDWGMRQPAKDIGDLIQGVVGAIDAAFETAVPGSDADPTTGRPPSSVGPSK